jgi:hypothetical protein
MKKHLWLGIIFISPLFVIAAGLTQAPPPKGARMIKAIIVDDDQALKEKFMKEVHEQEERVQRSEGIPVIVSPSSGKAEEGLE